MMKRMRQSKDLGIGGTSSRDGMTRTPASIG